MRTEHQVSAGGVLVRGRDGGHEVMLAARRVRSGDLVWGLPKGIVEEGEPPEAAARREVEEETGWRGDIGPSLGDIEYWYVWEGARIHKRVHFFLMTATGGDARMRDHEMEEVRWYTLEEAETVVGFESEREVLGRARAILEGDRPTGSTGRGA